MVGANAPKAILFVLFGASGSGKSTLMQQLKTLEPQVTIHQKVTDRHTRLYDSDEVICDQDVTASKFEYIYVQYGHKYGISKTDIVKSLRQGKHQFVICNDLSTIVRIKREFPGRVRALFMRYDAPRSILEAVQRARQITDDEIELRLQKIQALNQQFLDDPSFFDYVITNNFGATPTEMLQQVKDIIANEMGYEVREERVARLRNTSGSVADVVASMKEGPRPGSAIQPGFVVILMAMVELDPQLRDIHSALLRACDKASLHGERVADEAVTEQIDTKVLASISCAEYVIADVTHERPSVYYEVGYAHALDKQTVITARLGTTPHFYVRNYPVLFYSSTDELEEKTIEALQKLVGRGPESYSTPHVTQQA